MDSTPTSALETTDCPSSWCWRWVEIEADGMRVREVEHENNDDGCTAAADGTDDCSEGAIRALSF